MEIEFPERPKEERTLVAFEARCSISKAAGCGWWVRRSVNEPHAERRVLLQVAEYGGFHNGTASKPGGQPHKPLFFAIFRQAEVEEQI